MFNNVLKFQRITPDAILPSYGTPGAACFDISTIDETYVDAHDHDIVRTGLKFEVPDGHVMLVFSRSGHGFKNNIRLANCVGVIDSDYRGELMVKLTNDGSTAYKVDKYSRIAQAMILPVQAYTFMEVSELSSTVRGENGLGSTGTK